MAREVSRATRKPIRSQLIEILRLRFGPTRLGPGDYYALDLFDDSLDFEKQRSFVGWRMSAEIDRILNVDSSRILANDKIVNYQVLAAVNYPIPTTIATFSPGGRAVGGEVRLKDLDAVQQYLLTAPYPLFAKPVVGTFGRGALALAGFDDREDCLNTVDGKRLARSDFLEQLEFPPFNGYLFQQIVRPHRDIVEVAGRTVSCVRIGVLVAPKPAVHFAFWKIATGNNVTDNFSRGKSGNLLGAIDMESGQVTDVIAAPGPMRRRVTHHPTTNKTLIGFRIPMWQDVLNLCTSAANHFPGLNLQNWDVVVTDEGPVLMELNTEADLFAVNLLSRAGLFRGNLEAIISRKSAR